MSRKYTDEERFQLDIPPEQEDTRAEDEYNQEGLLYNDLSRIITGYGEHGVFHNHKSSVVNVLGMLLEKIEKENEMVNKVEELLRRIGRNVQGCATPCPRQVRRWIVELRAILKDPFSVYEEKLKGRRK